MLLILRSIAPSFSLQIPIWAGRTRTLSSPQGGSLLHLSTLSISLLSI